MPATQNNLSCLSSSLFLFLNVFLLINVVTPVAIAHQPASEPPNILLILVDDLGYTDVSAYGGNIPTPNIDHLASMGVRFSDGQVSPSCAPTRASLITGKDPHLVGFGSQNGVTPPGVSQTVPGYKGSLEGIYIGVAEMLKAGGYSTFMAGKWHLGTEPKQTPHDLGFDRYFILPDGAASHYSDRLAISLDVTPKGKVVYIEDGETVAELEDNFYSTNFYTNKVIQYLSQRDTSKPFFAYVAYTAVHDPLQAPQEVIEKYRGKFSNGFEKIRKERIQGLVESNIFKHSDFKFRWHGATPEWDSLTPLQKLDMSVRMEVYAAMLSILDSDVGKLIKFLKAEEILANTLIVFLSDNGAAPIPSTFYSKTSSDIEWLAENYPLSNVKDYGKPRSFATMGMPNAQVASGPFMGFKATLFEGGTRVPFIIVPPGSGSSSTVNNSLVHVSDLYQTFADYAGVSTHSQSDLFGVSLKPILQGELKTITGRAIGFEFLGQRSLRYDHWKLIFVPPSLGGTGKYALYNLIDDPGETYDLSDEHPELLYILSTMWDNYATKNGVVPADMNLVNEAFAELSKRLLDIDWGG